MIAIVKIGGHQAIVQEGEILEVDKIDVEPRQEISLETLLISAEDGSDCKIGTPVLEGVAVSAKVIEHGRGDKIRVFKMKPRKRYRKTQGHRQDFSVIEITKIGSNATAKKPETIKVAPKASTVKTTTKPAAAKPKTSTTKKPATKATANKAKAPAKKATAKPAQKTTTKKK